MYPKLRFSAHETESSLNLPISFESSGLRIFAFTLHWYGIVVVASAWIGAEIATWLAARDGREPGHVWRGLIWVSLFGIAGARLWYVLFPPDSVVANGLTAGWLLSHFFDLNQGAIAVWTGGTGLIGGIVGGVIGLAIYARRNDLPLLPWLDIAAVALALAQAIGRWANAASLDLYGPPTDLLWGVLVSAEEQRVGMYRDLSQFPLNSTRFHPVYAYESFLMVVVFAALLVAFLRYRDQLKLGDIALLYVALYGMSGGNERSARDGDTRQLRRGQLAARGRVQRRACLGAHAWRPRPESKAP